MIVALAGILITGYSVDIRTVLLVPRPLSECFP